MSNAQNQLPHGTLDREREVGGAKKRMTGRNQRKSRSNMDKTSIA